MAHRDWLVLERLEILSLIGRRFHEWSQVILFSSNYRFQLPDVCFNCIETIASINIIFMNELTFLHSFIQCQLKSFKISLHVVSRCLIVDQQIELIAE